MKNNITYETKLDSYNEIQSKLSDRHEQCLYYLKRLGEATASELAYELFKQGITDSFQRNYTHPRLNELVTDGLVEVVNKKKCKFSGRTVAVYRLVNRLN